MFLRRRNRRRSSKKLSNTEQKKKNNEMPILRNLNHIPEIKKYLKSYEKILVGYDKRIKALPRELRSTKRNIKKISQNLEKTSVFTNSGDPFGAPIKKGIKKYNRLQGELSQLHKNKKQKKEDLQTFKRRYNAINKYSNILQKQIRDLNSISNKGLGGLRVALFIGGILGAIYTFLKLMD